MKKLLFLLLAITLSVPIFAQSPTIIDFDFEKIFDTEWLVDQSQGKNEDGSSKFMVRTNSVVYLKYEDFGSAGSILTVLCVIDKDAKDELSDELLVKYSNVTMVRSVGDNGDVMFACFDAFKEVIFYIVQSENAKTSMLTFANLENFMRLAYINK